MQRDKYSQETVRTAMFSPAEKDGACVMCPVITTCHWLTEGVSGRISERRLFPVLSDGDPRFRVPQTTSHRPPERHTLGSPGGHPIRGPNPLFSVFAGSQGNVTPDRLFRRKLVAPH